MTQERDLLSNLKGESVLELIEANEIIRGTEGEVNLHQSAYGADLLNAAGSVAGMILGALVMKPDQLPFAIHLSLWLDSA